MHPTIPGQECQHSFATADKAGIPRARASIGYATSTRRCSSHQGADVKAVQLAMGHKATMITLNTYAGELRESGSRTHSIIDAAPGNVPAQCPDLEAQS